MLFEYLISNKEIPIISKLGQNTMAIYLFHGFIIRLSSKFEIFHYSIAVNLVLSCVIAFVIILTFGNKYVAWIFKKVF